MSLDNLSDTGISHDSFTLNIREKHSFHNSPGIIIPYKEDHSIESMIPPNNNDHEKSVQLKEHVGDASLHNIIRLGHHTYVKDTASPCISRRQLYRRLCGTSMYEVFKYSYDEYMEKILGDSSAKKNAVNNNRDGTNGVSCNTANPSNTPSANSSFTPMLSGIASTSKNN